jgi:hypothetical protein
MATYASAQPPPSAKTCARSTVVALHTVGRDGVRVVEAVIAEFIANEDRCAAVVEAHCQFVGRHGGAGSSFAGDDVAVA